MGQLVLEKENSEFKPVKLRLKIDIVSYPARAEGLVNSIIIPLSCPVSHCVSEKKMLEVSYWPSGLSFCKFPGRPGFNPRSSHTKDSKMVLDASLLNTQHYKVRIMGKVEQSRERSGAPLHLGVVSYRKRDPSGDPRLWSPILPTYKRIVQLAKRKDFFLCQCHKRATVCSGKI